MSTVDHVIGNETLLLLDKHFSIIDLPVPPKERFHFRTV